MFRKLVARGACLLITAAAVVLASACGARGSSGSGEESVVSGVAEGGGASASSSSVSGRNELTPSFVQSEYISPFGNLVYCPDFDKPEDIKGYMLLNWYREHINSTKDPDEIKRLYTKDGVDGYIYPAEEFEGYVQQYFSISPEHMRSNPTFEYDGTRNGYVIMGGGRGEEVKLLLDDTASISEKDGVITIRTQLINSENTSKGDKELKIRTMRDGSFHYLSYITLG